MGAEDTTIEWNGWKESQGDWFEAARLSANA
jgi:hypothetical protein